MTFKGWVWLAVLAYCFGFWTALVWGASEAAGAADQALAERVNRQVNSVYGQPPGYNCVDYSTDKRDALLAAGVDPADLELRVVRARVGGTRLRRPHQVLIVETVEGPIVLDNMTRKVWSLATFERNLSH